MTSVMLDSWCREFRPRSILPVIEWGAKHVPAPPGGARGPAFDPDQSYWLAAPLDLIGRIGAYEIYLVGPPGSSKTTLLEVGLAYDVAEDPGPQIVAFHTDQDATEWFASRGKPILRNCLPVHALWPVVANDDKKDAIYFPHMPLWVVGANKNSFQGKSCRRVKGDEIWCWRPGTLRELLARLHDRYDRQGAFTSQAGDEGSDLDLAVKSGTRHVAHFACPHCGTAQPWKWSQVRYDEQHDAEGNIDYESTANTTRYVCINEPCAAVFPDAISERRLLSSTLRYVQTNPKPSPGIHSFIYNALAVWWIPWRTLTVEWLKAMEAKKRGDLTAFIQFKQKRLSEFWSEDQSIPYAPLVGAAYVKDDYAEGQTWEGESFRFLTVDKQKDHYYAVARSWKADGSSRLLWEGKVHTDEQLLDLQAKFKILSPCCFMDARYETAAVYAFCARNKWFAILGDNQKSYTHIPKRGKPVQKYYSPIKPVLVGPGQYCNYLLFSNEKIKDIFSRLRSGRAQPWEIPGDISETYLFQVDSEIKKEVINKLTKQVEMRWVKIRPNHLFDCEVQQVVAAVIVGILGAEWVPEPLTLEAVPAEESILSAPPQVG